MRAPEISIPEAFFTSVFPEVEDLAELKILLCFLWLRGRKEGRSCFVPLRELLEALERWGLEGEAGRDGVRNLIRKGILQLVEEEGEEALALGEGTRLSKESPFEEDIFALYEENIGLLTPLIAERIKEAERRYPASWIRDAIREAVELNVRNWRYVERILQRWAREGRRDGEPQRYTKAHTSPEEYKGYQRFLKR